MEPPVFTYLALQLPEDSARHTATAVTQVEEPPPQFEAQVEAASECETATPVVEMSRASITTCRSGRGLAEFPLWSRLGGAAGSHVPRACAVRDPPPPGEDG